MGGETDVAGTIFEIVDGGWWAWWWVISRISTVISRSQIITSNVWHFCFRHINF
jgi:hypothetical protein